MNTNYKWRNKIEKNIDFNYLRFTIDWVYSNIQTMLRRMPLKKLQQILLHKLYASKSAIHRQIMRRRHQQNSTETTLLKRMQLRGLQMNEKEFYENNTYVTVIGFLLAYISFRITWNFLISLDSPFEKGFFLTSTMVIVLALCYLFDYFIFDRYKIKKYIKPKEQER